MLRAWLVLSLIFLVSGAFIYDLSSLERSQRNLEKAEISERKNRRRAQGSRHGDRAASLGEKVSRWDQLHSKMVALEGGMSRRCDGGIILPPRELSEELEASESECIEFHELERRIEQQIGTLSHEEVLVLLGKIDRAHWFKSQLISRLAELAGESGLNELQRIYGPLEHFENRAFFNAWKIADRETFDAYLRRLDLGSREVILDLTMFTGSSEEPFLDAESFARLTSREKYLLNPHYLLAGTAENLEDFLPKVEQADMERKLFFWYGWVTQDSEAADRWLAAQGEPIGLYLLSDYSLKPSLVSDWLASNRFGQRESELVKAFSSYPGDSSMSIERLIDPEERRRVYQGVMSQGDRSDFVAMAYYRRMIRSDIDLTESEKAEFLEPTERYRWVK